MKGQFMSSDTVSIPEIEIKRAKGLENAGTSVYQIDTLVLDRENDASLSDVLSRYSAVFIKNEGRGALSTASFRGTASSHTEVYWNGISLQSPMLGQVDFSLIPVYLMDDIRIIPGASSLIEGSGALGGSIDLSTDFKWKKGWQISGLSGYGSFDTWNEMLHILGGNKKIQTSTRIYYNSSKNNFPFINKNIASINPVTGEYIYPIQRNNNAEYLISGLMQGLALRFKHNWKLKAYYWYQYVNRALPRLNTYEGNDAANLSRQQEKVQRGIIQLSKISAKTKWDISSGIMQTGMLYIVKNQIFGRGYYNAVYSKSDITGVYNKVQFSWVPQNNTIIKASSFFNYYHVNTRDTVSGTGYNKYRSHPGIMLSLQKKFTNTFSVLALMRNEWVNSRILPVIPYVGFNWVLNKKYLSVLHGNIAYNYKYPNLNDLYWKPGGNPHLLPENGLATELGIKTKFLFGSLNGKFSGTVFYNDIKNWIIWVPSPMGYWSPQNIRKVHSYGFELKWNLYYHIHNWKFNLQAGYAFTKSINFGSSVKWGSDAVGKQIPYVPVHSGNVIFNVAYKNLFLTWVNHDYSERYTTSANQLNLRDWLYPYFMNNLYIGGHFSYSKKSKGTLKLKIYNLFNEHYRSVLGRPMPGRNVMLLFTFHI